MPSIIQTKDGGKIVRTCCFECHAKCGALCHVDANGKLFKIEGDPEDPRNEGRLCPKGRGAVQVLYNPERINYPMKRVGKRGEGKWECITWDEAMDTIYNKIVEYRNEFGPESIVNAQGTGRGSNQWNSRLGNTIGINHWLSPGHICLGPILTTGLMTLGMVTNWEGADLDRSEVQVFWGSNQVWSEATYTDGPVNRGRNRGAKLIVIDPNIEHPLASKADYFLGLRPGSDSALAMAWLNIIISEKLYDAKFCKHWSTLSMLIHADESMAPVSAAELFAGADPKHFAIYDCKSDTARAIGEGKIPDEFDPALEGYYTLKTVDGKEIRVRPAMQALAERAAEMTPEKAAKICWLRPNEIYESAKMYATAKSAAISYFQGLEEHTNSRQTLHAVNTIMTICGYLDVYGGNIWPKFWNVMLGDRMSGKPTDPDAMKKRLNPYPMYVASHPREVFRTMKTGKPYPIKMYLGIAGNPLTWSEQPQYAKEALLNVDFIVQMDYFFSPTAQLADLVLPSAHWTERDYIADEQCGRWYFGQPKSVEPLFERRSDITFLRELGRRLNPEMWPWETDEQLFDFQLEPDGITYEQLKEQHIFEHTPDVERKYEEHGFETPTKRAECYSTIFFHMSSNPLPSYEEPAESPLSNPELAKEYPFVLTTGRRYPHFYHSQYRNVPYLRELSPEPRVMINTLTAEKFGIKENDMVCVESKHGRFQMKAQLTDGLHPRVVAAPHGWWAGCEALNLPDYPDFIANCNVCVSNENYDKLTGSPGARSTLCKIFKV